MTRYSRTMSEAYASMYPIDEATMSSSQIARLKKAYEPMRDKKISPSNANKLSAMMDKVGKDKEALIQLFKADIPFVSQSAVTQLITKHDMKGAEINKLREEVDLDEAEAGIKVHAGPDHDRKVKRIQSLAKQLGAKVTNVGKSTDGKMSTIHVKGSMKVVNDLMKLRTEEVDLDEDASNFKSAVARIKKAKSAKDLKKLEKSFERVYKQTGALTDKEFGQLDDMISDKLVKLGEEVDLDEAKIKVSIEGLPDIYMDGQSAGQIKMQLRKMLKKPDMLKDVERVPETDYKQAMRDRVSGKDKKEPEDELDEGTKQVLAHGGKGKYKVTKDGDKIDIKFGGKVVGTADFDRGADSFFVSIKGEKGQKSFDDAQAIADYFAKNKITEEVDLDEGKMSQLHQYIKDKKSAEEIAKLMKLDVKTIKSLMSEIEPDDEEEEIKEGAAADARRAMSKDKDLRRGKDSADDDDSATDDDVKAASKNIMMQLRKSISLKGRFDVEFGDKKKTKIPAAMAQAVTQKYNSLKKPVDKEKFQAKIAKSYKDMLKTMKEGFKPSETILERMNRKLRENKNG